MWKKLFLLATPALLCAVGPSFEVASVKPSLPFTMERMGPQLERVVKIDPARAAFRNCSLLSLIAHAWRVREYQVSGPEWMENVRFDIAAKLPKGASTDTVPEMLQALLGDRFKLRLHPEERVLPVYALITGKEGPKLSPKPENYDPWHPGNFHARTMERFAIDLSDAVDRPVINQTFLQGEYLVPIQEILRASLFRYTSQVLAPLGIKPPQDEGINIFALVQQWGFKLDSRKLPTPMLIVDRIERTPTEN